MQASAVEIEPGAVAGDGGGVAAAEVAAADAGAADEGAAEPRLLMFGQGYGPDGGLVLSMWSDCLPGSMVAAALSRLRAAGWFDGGDPGVDADPVVARRHAIAGAVMLSVSAFEGALRSAGASPQACRLLVDVLLDGSDVPDAVEWDRVTGDV